MPQRVEAGWVERRLEEGDAAVLAVVPAEEFERGHLPGAVNIPLQEESLPSSVEDIVPDKEATVIVYGDGVDSQAASRAARMLESLGYRRVFEFKAGLPGWTRTGHAVEEGHAAA